MRTFLGVLMVLYVSGDDMTITGIIDGSVLLPCTCSERNLDKEFSWQMEEPNMKHVLKYSNSIPKFYGRYNGRSRIFLPENINNCSLLLNNITADDLGKYRCRFYRGEIYKRSFVNLNISASYNICQKDSTSNMSDGLRVKVFQCDAEGRYKEAEVQWNLDGHHLTNSPTTSITHIFTLDVSTGLYHFTSNLTTNFNWTSEPTCDVKSKDVSTIISYDCRATAGNKLIGPEENKRYRYWKVIPIMFLLGVSIVLWCRWESSQSSRKVREVRSNNL